MATRKTTALIGVVFVTALVAGGAAGMLATRYLAPATPVVVTGELPLSEALQLTPTQRDQIRQIWESVRSINEKAYGEGEMLGHLRDDEILKILNDDQKKEFFRINQEYQEKYTAMDARRKLAFNDAVEKTKQLLNEDQRRRYEQILANRMGPDRSTGQPASTTTRPSAESPAASANFSLP
jgi:Spy/CpxP family protein refolding chaperone